MLREIFDFELSPDSDVFDVGGYHGLWTELLIQHLGFSPNVYIFEPITSRLPSLRERFRGNPKIRLLAVGLGKSSYQTSFAVAGDATGAWASSLTTEPVYIWDCSEFMKGFRGDIDLISINCEGGEYDILERMLETDIAKNCKYIQVQFHNLFPEASDRRDKIREALTLTHTEKYNIPWAWEAWKRS